MSVVFWAVMLAVFGPALIPLIVIQALNALCLRGSW